MLTYLFKYKLMSVQLKKTRRKLELLQEEGINELLLDMMGIASQLTEGAILTSSRRIELIENMKRTYLSYIEENSPSNPKQTKLF